MTELADQGYNMNTMRHQGLCRKHHLYGGMQADKLANPIFDKLA